MPTRSEKRSKRKQGERPLARSAWVRLAVLVAFVLVIAGAAALWWQIGRGAPAKRAAIVDQLSLTSPDQAFVDATTTALEKAGYTVDYYPGDQVTVEFYRYLPQHHYGLIVLRAHSGLSTITNLDTHQVTHTNSVSLFTGQPFDTSLYQAERDAGRLGRSRYVEDGEEVLGVFGIEPSFVQSSMQGRFDNTLVVLMGCNGLDAPAMAQAFISKGASAVVGYDDFVSASFTDAVTSDLIERLFNDHTPLPDAVKQTSDQFGPDPEYGGRLQLVTG
jgi:hypothetical protein